MFDGYVVFYSEYPYNYVLPMRIHLLYKKKREVVTV